MEKYIYCKIIPLAILFILVIFSCKSEREKCYDDKSFYFNYCLLDGLNGNEQKISFDPANNLFCRIWLLRELDCEGKEGFLPYSL